MRLSCLWLLLLLPSFDSAPSGLAQDKQEDAAAGLKAEGWRAVRSLVDRGEASRSALEKAVAGGDPDVAFLAAAALGELDCRKSGDFAPVPRTRNLRGKASDVVAALFQSAGLEAARDGLPGKELAIPDDLSFAEALDAASRELNVEFVQAENGTWNAGGAAAKGPRFAWGRVRARIDEITHGTYWQPGLAPRCLYWIGVRMDGFGRFRQPPLYADLRVVEAVDEHGRDLRPKRDWFEESIDRRNPKEKERRAVFTVSLEAPDLKSTKVARLRLAVDFAFRKKEGVIAFDKLDGARNITKKVGDVEATLLRAGMEDQEFQVELRLRAPGIGRRVSKDDEDDLFGGDLVAHLLDAAGKGWDDTGGGSGSDGLEYTVTRSFRNADNVGPPATLSVALITDVENRSVSLEFRDVPLR